MEQLMELDRHTRLNELFNEDDDILTEDYQRLYDIELSRLEFEIKSIRHYLGQLEIKYYNMTGDDI
jgi:hypothetical protein